jgi:hypothetical protein
MGGSQQNRPVDDDAAVDPEGPTAAIWMQETGAVDQ